MSKIRTSSREELLRNMNSARFLQTVSSPYKGKTIDKKVSKTKLSTQPRRHPYAEGYIPSKSHRVFETLHETPISTNFASSISKGGYLHTPFLDAADASSRSDLKRSLNSWQDPNIRIASSNHYKSQNLQVVNPSLP